MLKVYIDYLWTAISVSLQISCSRKYIWYLWWPKHQLFSWKKKYIGNVH